jgi:hypothetical protein
MLLGELNFVKLKCPPLNWITDSRVSCLLYLNTVDTIIYIKTLHKTCQLNHSFFTLMSTQSDPIKRRTLNMKIYAWTWRFPIFKLNLYD